MWRAILRFGAMPLAALAVGCASSGERVDGAFHHRRHGYTIAPPEGPWRRVTVEYATLAFRRGDFEVMHLKSRCGKPVARAELMARSLLIKVEARDIVVSRPIPVDGRSGWLQVVNTGEDGRPVRQKTVTLVVGDCSFDWSLATSADFGSAEVEFDAWWQSFRLEATRHGEAGA